MNRFFFTGLLVAVLIGVIVVRILRRSHSHGLSVGVVTAQCSSPHYLEALRLLRLRIVDDGGLFINDDPVSAGRLQGRLDELYKVRDERVLFFDASNSVSFQQAVATIEIAQSAVPGLRVILITPRTREECQRLWERPGAY